MRVSQFIAVTWLALVCALAPAYAEKRVALVVGNDRYANLPAHEQLQKAVNDARAVGGALEQIGFEVITGENLDRRAMVAKLNELVRRLSSGDMVFFFFSGHGVALDGVNYILPADVPDIAPGQETSLKAEALAESYIVSELHGRGVRLAVVVLDACRTNPFSRPGGRGVGGDKGLVVPPPVKGVFSFYAATSGQAALDRLADGDPNPNSVFSRVLVPALTRPGVDLAALAIEVREEVARIAQTAGYAQWPAYYDETIGGRVYLAGAPPDGGKPVPTGVPDVAQAWAALQGTTSLAMLDEFIRQYGNAPFYGSLAKARREELAKEQKPAGGPQTAAVALPATPATPLTLAQERGLKRGDTFRECENCPEMVVLPAGSFTMGMGWPERNTGPWPVDWGNPQHVVTIGKAFAVGKLHVTVDQFTAFVGESRRSANSRCSWHDPGFAQEGSHPVICVTWDDAKAYVDWLAGKTGRPYRLLSEAEWEYAAHGRTSPGNYPLLWHSNAGDSGTDKDLCRYGNVFDQAAIAPVRGGIRPAPLPANCNDGYRYTSPAGHYEPNPFGLYDMFGNAEQWTADCWHADYNGTPGDGSAWTTGCQKDFGGEISHVSRGSSYATPPDAPPEFLGDAVRKHWRISESDQFTGFRVARTLAQPK